MFAGISQIGEQKNNSLSSRVPNRRRLGLACGEPHPGTHEPALDKPCHAIPCSACQLPPTISCHASEGLSPDSSCWGSHSCHRCHLNSPPVPVTLGFSFSSLLSLTVLAHQSHSPKWKSPILTCFPNSCFCASLRWNAEGNPAPDTGQVSPLCATSGRTSSSNAGNGLPSSSAAEHPQTG